MGVELPEPVGGGEVDVLLVVQDGAKGQRMEPALRVVPRPGQAGVHLVTDHQKPPPFLDGFQSEKKKKANRPSVWGGGVAQL